MAIERRLPAPTTQRLDAGFAEAVVAGFTHDPQLAYTSVGTDTDGQERGAGDALSTRTRRVVLFEELVHAGWGHRFA